MTTQDTARREFTVTTEAARLMVERASDDGKKLLKLFADHQFVPLWCLREIFRKGQRGLNLVLGNLVTLYRKVEATENDSPEFYIWFDKLGAWAVGHDTQRALQAAFGPGSS